MFTHDCSRSGPRKTSCCYRGSWRNLLLSCSLLYAGLLIAHPGMVASCHKTISLGQLYNLGLAARCLLHPGIDREQTHEFR